MEVYSHCCQAEVSFSMLKGDFESTAEWRREIASQHPDDSRHVGAAELLERLVKMCDDIDPAVLEAYAALFRNLRDMDAHAEMLRWVGFDYWPATAEEFCRDFIADRTLNGRV
jgi:hypothetical protein